MAEDDVDPSTNVNYQRGISMLEDRFDTPEQMIKMWRVLGSCKNSTAPALERCRPWFAGLEDLL